MFHGRSILFCIDFHLPNLWELEVVNGKGSHPCQWLCLLPCTIHSILFGIIIRRDIIEKKIIGPTTLFQVVYQTRKRKQL
ncbi:hypothetical protein AQUCO_00400094v1 [Aquilegia coerulea]|uniref:Uncharacterized protein n=1 Tax=Aquilegia coerulea TaxID=218851 RepID=A0A2G5ETB7_AQUCA|nr:hypothetical protein AQUCO_00400094v1 [Aquilegia coerulea]